ncbi:uncharacterized protein LOC126739355 isoform X2 [Anthonomus grandis grandis]|uniref:uncharacterized protein LOC126739355 isoform X2 n=1 Tax=Anthonomus grandis grandis TaxID=2921223 RepID=UPI0021666524|nr:uncharacterized protein LOC126739355 isoform X2 [Anthonomus grandis grandis]
MHFRARRFEIICNSSSVRLGCDLCGFFWCNTKRMSRWIHLLIFGAAIGVAKSASFVKLVILAGLGLAGLWMVHTLAQDFSNITQNGFGSAGEDHGGGAKLFNDQEIKVFKRSIQNQKNEHRINWEMVIKRDPASCARSFICQLAATKEADLTDEEKIILNLTRTAATDETWASKQLNEALKNGKSITYPYQCMKMYKFCPYTKRMMMTLIRVFGNR